MTDDQLQKAKKKALMLLTDRDRSVAELTEKLQKAGYEEAIIKETLSYVSSFGYLDDARYARHFIEYYSGSRSYQRIRFDMGQKGLSKAVIDDAFEALEDPDEKPLIRKLVAKKWRTVKGERREKEAKVIQSLGRKGFRIGDIRAVLEEMEEPDDPEEEV
ncbi:MAG: regulatory protein RecX [Lachnospiraceae bacterium]|nr:regulatory protein RecX [Lachnospiraceae bacterium]